MIFIFLRFSLLHELLASKLHFDPYLLLIFGALTVLFTVISGGIPRAIRHSAGPFWLAFSALLILATVFSTWRGGSIGIMANFFKTDLPGYFGIAGLVCTWRECRRLLNVMAAAGVVFVIAARIFGSIDGGRLEVLPVASVGNSNDLSAHLLFLIPFMVTAALFTGVPKVVRFFLAGSVFLGIYLTLQTASRGALIALVAAVLFVLMRGSARQKLVFGLMAALGGSLMFVGLATSFTSRFETLFSDSGDVRTNEATGSKAARLYLLEKSIEITVQHPLLGVGPGQFGVIEGEEAKDQGHRGAWQVTHNAYTEISSEAGIPALICVLGALASTSRSLRKALLEARLRGDKEIETAIFCISTCIVCLCVAIFFLAMGFRVYLPAITGIGVAVAAAARNELMKRANPERRRDAGQPSAPYVRRPVVA